MTEGFGLRLAREPDLPRIGEVIASAYDKYVGRMDPLPAPLLHDYQKEVRDESVWVGGTPIIALIVLIRIGDSLLIENIAVEPSAQGSGVGRRLMDFAEREAVQRGIDRLALYTSEVMTENLAIYHHLGYAEVDRRFDNGYQRVFMEKRLLPFAG